MTAVDRIKACSHIIYPISSDLISTDLILSERSALWSVAANVEKTCEATQKT